MIEEILKEIELFIEGKSDKSPMEMSLYLEGYFIENYNEMEKENKELNFQINDTFIDLFAEFSSDMEEDEIDKIIVKIKLEYERLDLK